MRTLFVALTCVFLSSCANVSEKQVVDPPNSSTSKDESATRPPDLPESSYESCLDYAIMDEFQQAQDEYFETMKINAASGKGWVFLDLPESVERHPQNPEPGYEYFISSGKLEEVATNHFTDEAGQHWLMVGESGACTHHFGEYAMDRKGNVFRVLVSRTCENEGELFSCGTIGRGGCGMHPHPEIRLSWFVRVPEGAVFSSTPRELTYTVNRCVEIIPSEGFSVPP